MRRRSANISSCEVGPGQHRERHLGHHRADLGLVLDGQLEAAPVEAGLGRAEPRADDRVVAVAEADPRDRRPARPGRRRAAGRARRPRASAAAARARRRAPATSIASRPAMPPSTSAAASRPNATANTTEVSARTALCMRPSSDRRRKSSRRRSTASGRARIAPIGNQGVVRATSWAVSSPNTGRTTTAASSSVTAASAERDEQAEGESALQVLALDAPALDDRRSDALAGDVDRRSPGRSRRSRTCRTRSAGSAARARPWRRAGGPPSPAARSVIQRRPAAVASVSSAFVWVSATAPGTPAGGRHFRAPARRKSRAVRPVAAQRILWQDVFQHSKRRMFAGVALCGLIALVAAGVQRRRDLAVPARS